MFSLRTATMICCLCTRAILCATVPEIKLGTGIAISAAAMPLPEAYSTLQMASQADCADACAQDGPRCRAWVYTVSGGDCRLKASFGAYAAGDDIVGIKPLALFSAGELGVVEYRIPLLLALPPANTTLLAFAEARLNCTQSCGKTSFWGDSSPTHVAFRRSTGGGQTWSPTRFIARSNGTRNDNLNLGSVV